MLNEDIIRSIRVHLDEISGCGGCKYYEHFPEATCFLHMIEDAANAIEEVVHCGECRNGILWNEAGEIKCKGEHHKPNWFCADGERKDKEHG